MSDQVENPHISVIMSVYNGEKYLRKSINSILNQTYDNFEFIIIDDGSNDSSLRVIKDYMAKDNRIIVVEQNNLGLTKSLNKGISMSRGEYIARQDADDVSLPNRLSRQLDIIKAENIDIVGTRAYKNNNIVPSRIVIKFNSLSSLQIGNIFIHGTLLGKKSIFKKIMYDENYYYAQDFKFILDCYFSEIKVGYILEPLYMINDNEENISNTKMSEQNNFVRDALKYHFSHSVYFDSVNYFRSRFLRNSLKTLYLIFFSFFSSSNKHAKNIK